MDGAGANSSELSGAVNLRMLPKITNSNGLYNMIGKFSDNGQVRGTSSSFPGNSASSFPLRSESAGVVHVTVLLSNTVCPNSTSSSGWGIGICKLSSVAEEVVCRLTVTTQLSVCLVCSEGGLVNSVVVAQAIEVAIICVGSDAATCS